MITLRKNPCNIQYNAGNFHHRNRPMALVIMLLLFSMKISAQVNIYTGTETIPTYRMGPDETSPIFYTGRGVQGAAGHYYPYPAQISLGDEKSDVTYEMVYLENEYLKVTIIPALGGKLYSALDKTNGHEIFHRNSTIKPDLIGTLGAWISGGIEWCFPHHHRTTTMMPADYRLVKNPDGSATVWVGETEKSLRLRGVIGITLRPGQSTIEAEYRLSNPNPVTRNFKFWANVAVTADEDFRTFWPPSQEIAVFHNNSSFTRWPISHEVYRGVDYSSGVDLTWWKNHPSPVSFFFWQGEEGFIGGYNYRERAGMVHVGDTYKSRISKLWQFGPGPEGQNARRKLTDDGKAYVELMTGTFSNNQPDYSWFAPHMVKRDHQVWYPLRDIEMAKNANEDAAITLQVRKGNQIFYGVNTTRLMEDARLSMYNGGTELFSETVTVSPENPYTSTWKGKNAVDEYQLKLVFSGSDGIEIISYAPSPPKKPDLPEPFESFKPAEEYNNAEDLYLTGRAVEQFSRPNLDPDDYYLHALELSPTDYRVNIALGIRRVNQWRFAEADTFFRNAAEKLQYEYIQMKEGELYYYWALAQRALGKRKEAYRNFSYAAYHYAWFSAAHYQLAQMESELGNPGKALDHIEDAWSTNNLDAGIVVLYSALLRTSDRGPEAIGMLEKAIDFDPLNYALLYERQLITGESPVVSMQPQMQDLENNYMEIATNYLNAGMYEDMLRLLTGVREPENPLFLYYRAYALDRTGEEEQARSLVRTAREKSFEGVFPYRIETEKVLRFVTDVEPAVPYGHYLLGNLLYDKRPDEAMAEWETAARSEMQMPMIERTLAFGQFHHQQKVDEAIETLTRAIRAEPDHPLWYDELLTYYDASDRDPKECLALLESHEEVVRRNVSAPKGLVRLYNLNGNYDRAIALLDSHHFRTWEGGRNIYWHYVDAHLLKAFECMDRSAFEEARTHLARAMEYPENLEVGKPMDDERNAQIYYVLGRVYDQLGAHDEAAEAFRKSVDCTNSRAWPDLEFYQGMSLLELNRNNEAQSLFSKLADRGTEMLKRITDHEGIGVEEVSSAGQRHSAAEGYYLQGLASLGRGETDQAGKMFALAAETYRGHLWAAFYRDHGGF